MEKVIIEKETMVRPYGEFWGAFSFLKKSINPNVKGWYHSKLSALMMSCFTIEAFANHIGKELFPSWDSIERGISAIGKLKMFIEMKGMEIKYQEAPFNTVYELMKWRNLIVHGKTETIKTSHTASLDDYEDLLTKIEQPGWLTYVTKVNIERIEKDCIELMETIYLKAFGNLDQFLFRTSQKGSALLKF